MPKLYKQIEYFIDNEGCWNCISHRVGAGYPKVWANGKLVSLHRAVYEKEHGRPPADRKIVVMHKCGNKLCFNPSHLELGTQSKNVSDGKKKRKFNIERIETLIECGVNPVDIIESQVITLNQFNDIEKNRTEHKPEIYIYDELSDVRENIKKITVTLDKDITKQFQLKLLMNDHTMRDVIENYMAFYIESYWDLMVKEIKDFDVDEYQKVIDVYNK